MPAHAAIGAEAHERGMGRWSARLAEAMLDVVALHPCASVPDAGCRTGALSAAIAARGPQLPDLLAGIVRNANAQAPFLGRGWRALRADGRRAGARHGEGLRGFLGTGLRMTRPAAVFHDPSPRAMLPARRLSGGT